MVNGRLTFSVSSCTKSAIIFLLMHIVQVLCDGMKYRIFILLEDQELDEGVQKDSGENYQISKAASSRKKKDKII